uniref:Uncharacterized protein n=1 Tax=Pararge aegeria TaxID=116150 RepID=S4P9E6_9NEOP
MDTRITASQHAAPKWRQSIGDNNKMAIACDITRGQCLKFLTIYSCYVAEVFFIIRGYVDLAPFNFGNI